MTVHEVPATAGHFAAPSPILKQIRGNGEEFVADVVGGPNILNDTQFLQRFAMFLLGRVFRHRNRRGSASSQFIERGSAR